MAATVATSSVAGFSPFLHSNISSSTSSARFKPLPRVTSAPRSVLLTEQSPPATDTVRSDNIEADTRLSAKHEHVGRAIGSSLNDFFQQATEILIRSDGGPPRWFSPLECGGSRLNNSPLLLYLPGIDCTGYGLMLHHQRLGEIFDVWCLHIPLSDRTPFTELVKLVETTVRSENELFPRRPIYLVGESFGGCLALAVASRNPNIDLVLILANPATCFSKSQLQPLIAMLKIIPDQLRLGVPYILSLMTGMPSRMVMAAAEKGFPSQETVADLSDTVAELLSYLSDLTDVLTVETLLWKLKMIEAACEYANSRLHAVSAHTLLLSSGRDQLLPSLEEGQRLRRLLPNCVIRTFNESGHNLFLEDVHDLVTIIKGASFYRRGRNTDYASDFLPPSPLEIEKIVHSDSLRLLDVATSPVMLSTLENGEIVRGLAGIPSEGPILFVGYHNMLGFEVTPMIRRILIERDILVRGLAHPMLFTKLAEGIMPDPSAYDVARVMGAVPATPSNFYKLLSVKSHVLLYPGGVREALHRKGEEYKLFWPQQSEFVRMAARFGATIIAFGAVGEDDFGQLVFDYNDQMKFPPMKALAEGLTNESVKLRTDFEGEVGNQDLHLPVLAPKLPGRYYYLFGKPIETKERRQELRNRGTAHELYLEVKSEVENCLAYLKERREHDPYRSIMARLLYQATHDPDSEIPSFEIR